jgi:RimJ/RimL family protein N-acetyltransferase
MEHDRTRSSTVITFRPATVNDCDLYFEWVNDDLVRKNSFNSDKILYDTHKNWFNKKISSPKCKMIIAECDGVPIGQIRLDFENDKVCIDISVDKKHRRIGLGAKMLSQIGPYLQSAGIYGHLLTGSVKSENKASRKAFESAGFLKVSKNETEIKYQKPI